MRKKSNGRTSKVDFESAFITRSDLRRGVIGKYAREAGNPNCFVKLDADIAREFPSSDVVNKALRLVVQLKQVGKVKRKSA